MDPLNIGAGQFLTPPTQNDEAIGNVTANGNLNAVTSGGKPPAVIKDELATSTAETNLAGGVYDSGNPNPPKVPKRAAADVALFVATGGTQGSGGSGNAYFAPNTLAVLTAHMYKFYSSMRTSELAMAQVVNKGMQQTADMSKATAAAQIAIGEAERNKAIGQAVMGGLTVAGGAISLIGVGAALFKGMKKTGGIKNAKKEADTAKKALDDSALPDGNVATKKAAYTAKVDALKDARGKRDAFKAELDDIQNPKSDRVSTEPLRNKVDVEADIKAANKNVRAKRAEVREAEKDFDIASNEQKAISKDYYQKQDTYKGMESRQYQELNNATQVTQAFTAMFSGAGQVVTGVINSFEDMTIAEKNALITLLQTQMQNTNRLSDSASQSGSGTKDNMNSLLSALDNMVQKTNEANRPV